MKKRTRRPARHFHPLGIVLLAALAICSSLALWTRARRIAARKNKQQGDRLC